MKQNTMTVSRSAGSTSKLWLDNVGFGKCRQTLEDGEELVSAILQRIWVWTHACAEESLHHPKLHGRWLANKGLLRIV
jgi:hypothetical protein